MTCSHCGKENQDHYKFCLGCGRELTRPAPAPAPAAAPSSAATTGHGFATGGTAPSPLETARTVLPPAPVVAAGELAGSVAPKPKGGIPWNDAPKMPAGISPSPAFAPSFNAPNPLAPTSAPRMPTAPTPALDAPAAAGPAPSNGTTTCPTCGKPVQPGFAFCGACGTRIAKAPSGQAAALGVQRTMYGSGMAPTPAPVVAPRGRLVLIRPDGTEGGTHPLHDGDTLIGRGQGTLFEADAYLSPRHAEFTAGPNGLVVRDLRSLNGVFLKLTGEEALESGDIFRLGQELLRFEVISPPQPLEDGTEIMGTPNPGFWGRLSVIVGRDVDGSAFPLFGDAIVLGRERGDILFPEDGYVSGTHARISLNDGAVILQDLGSSNGTFLRLRHERNVPNGSFILMGQQLFRVEFR
ncbi:MAG TPA: FHA domain-containing protein [Polyangia bacterium]|nr:FHA domain-containing protein [Polyangia bacterium]